MVYLRLSKCTAKADSHTLQNALNLLLSPTEKVRLLWKTTLSSLKPLHPQSRKQRMARPARHCDIQLSGRSCAALSPKCRGSQEVRKWAKLLRAAKLHHRIDRRPSCTSLEASAASASLRTHVLQFMLPLNFCWDAGETGGSLKEYWLWHILSLLVCLVWPIKWLLHFLTKCNMLCQASASIIAHRSPKRSWSTMPAVFGCSGLVVATKACT